MSDEREGIWTPDEDPRYQRMKAASDVYEQVQSCFSGLEDLPELAMQAASAALMQSLMATEQQFLLGHLLQAIKEVCPPVIQERIVKRYRIINAKAQAALEQARAKHFEEMTQHLGERWRSGQPPEWTPDTETPGDDEGCTL